MVIKTNTINTSNVLAGFVAYLQEEDVIYAFLVQILGAIVGSVVLYLLFAKLTSAVAHICLEHWVTFVPLTNL